LGKCIAVASLLVLVQGAILAQEEEEEISVNFELGVFSKYVYRGILITDDAVAQPLVELEWQGLTFGVWSNHDLTNINGTDFEPSEVDYILSCERDVAGVTFEAGAVRLCFPNTPYEATTELYLKAELSDIPFAPSLGLYRDVDEVEGTYASLSFEQDVVLGETAALSLGLALGYGSSDHNVAYYGVDDGALADVVARATLGVALSENISVGTTVAFSSLLDDDVRDIAPEPDNVVIGVTFIAKF